MEFKLDLLQNSYDYIENSLELFSIADEYGEHRENRTMLSNKRKWKLAFITLVQALELLFKEKLFRTNNNLIYEDIDLEKVNVNKTIGMSKAINRIRNLTDTNIKDKDLAFIKKSVNMRNTFIHNTIEISSLEIKKKYCFLFMMYLKLHRKMLEYDIPLKDARKICSISSIKRFVDNKYSFFRGEEFSQEEIEKLKKDLEENSLYDYYMTYDNKIVKRIPYGEENNFLGYKYNRGTEQYCDACGAKLGEYHLDLCDLEVCPACKKQMLSCGCIKEKCKKEV